jgi:hypothetical protein
MKVQLVILVLATVLGSTAMASTSKICFGSTKGDDSIKGTILGLEVTTEQVTIKPIKGDNEEEATYPAYNTSVHGRDGKLYLEYKGYDDGEYQTVLMVDQELLHNGTTGLLQFRARGEGFFNSVYFCRDAK